MTINLTVISERLKKGRETLSYGLEDASIACGITPERLISLESGSSMPTGDEILILASLYKCDFLQLIDGSLPGPSDLTEILYRRYGASFDKNDRRAIQEFLQFCQFEKQLEQMLGIQKIPPKFQWTGNFYKGHGAEIAKKLRTHLNHPMNSVKLDIYSDFRRIGVHIFRRKLRNKEISGLYINDPIAGHCVLVNFNEDIYRQRFSVAHEVAHSIFDSNENIVVSYESNSEKYSTQDLIEIRANSFASNYLMPPEMLEKVSTWDTNTFTHWAQQFRVSTSALAKALKDQKILTPAVADNLKNFKKPKLEKIDPEAPESLTTLQRTRRQGLLELGLSDYYVSLCCDAHQKELVSTSRLCELLGAEQSELLEIGKLFGWTIKHGL